MRTSKQALLAAAALVSPLWATPAIAQTAAPEAASEDTTPGEIIVTARKRDERLMDVPVAISALSTEQIERYQTNTLTTIGQQVPQLIVAESQNQVGGSINLRGIGAGISNPSTESAVTINVDGVPISYGNAIRLGQLDLGRVEVLKGPQALFYGKNSPGGIISLISQDPSDDFEAKLRTGYEFEADQKFVEAVLSGPVTDTIGARVIGYYSKEDGWFRNIAVPVPGVTPGPGANSYNAEQIFARGTLTFDSPDGGTRLKAKINYGERTRDGVGPTGGSQIVECPGETSRFGAADCKLDRNFYNVIIPERVTSLDPTFGDGVPFTDSRQFLASLSADQDLGDTLILSSVTGYYRLDEESVDPFTFANTAYFAASNDIKADGFSQELRLSSDFDGPLQFLIGGFYQDADFAIRQAFAVDFGAPFLVGSTFYNVETHAASVFGQLRYDLLDTLELAAGGRYSWEKKRLSGTSFGAEFEVADPDKKYTDFSPEVTLTWRPSTDLTAYAAYREGFTSGGFNTAPTTLRSDANPERPLLDLSYGQMTARGGEVGLKGYVADRQISFDVTAYYFEYSGLQLSRYDNASFTQLTQNAGGAESKGLEFTMSARPRALDGFTLNASVGYNDATYTDFIGGCYAGQSIDAGCNLNPRNPDADPATFGTAANPYQDQDQTGQRLFRAPEFALTFGGVYDHSFSDNLGASLALDTNYSSDYVTQTEGNPRNKQDSYWQLNGVVSLNGGDDKPWELSLIGRNLTNELVIVAGSVVGATAGGTGTNTVFPGDILGGISTPRTVLLQLTLRNSLFGGF
jgi:iron complex outermembrane recepter protein